MKEQRQAAPRPPALWPAEPEVHHHLHYRPYVVLDVPFDPGPPLREALALRDQFVPHRDSEPPGSWRSLALRAAGGDHRSTTQGPAGTVYAATALAEQCPATMKLLERLTDLSMCGRVRFMWLEPGGRIPVHADFDDRLFPAGLAVNVSLNMPAGCRFASDLRPDGAATPYTVEVPFSDAGSVVVFNNAKHHSVVNDSGEPRIHLVFHGPLRVAPEQILAAARRQNGLWSAADVLLAILQKRADLGEPLDDLAEDVRGQARTGGWPAPVALVVMDAVLGDDEELRRRCLHRISSASLYPLPHRRLAPAELDAWLAGLPAEVRYAVIVGSGTYVARVDDFVWETFGAIVQMCKQARPLLGHLLDRMGDHDNQPCLHEQFAILDLAAWRSWGRPSFGALYGCERGTFPPYRASPETVHDDYTPLWLDPDPDGRATEGRRWWGSQVIATALEHARHVVNVPTSLRATKRFAYPNLAAKAHLEEVDQAIAMALDGIARWVYCFNTEPLAFPVAPGFQPERLLCVAAGFKWLGILEHYAAATRPVLELVDCNPAAIAYLEALLESGSYETLLSVVEEFEARNPGGRRLAAPAIGERVDQVVERCFGGDRGALLAALRSTRVATAHQLDFLADSAALATLFDRAKPTLFWHSNAWHGQGAFYRYCPDELERNYMDLLRRIGERLRMPGRCCPARQLAVFGDGAKPHTVLIGADAGEWAADAGWIPVVSARPFQPATSLAG